MDRWSEIEASYATANQCHICGTHIKGPRKKLDDHVATHSGTQYATADPNGQSHATRNANTARHWEAMAMSKEQGLADDELERIRHMAESRPAKVRFTGGMFTSGPLRGVRVDGAPSFFNESDGSIKKNFRWVTSARMQKRSRRSTRRPRIAPYSNTRFLPTDAEINQGFVEIKCNVFNHGKYKH
ncbi:hypothetical protein AUP68_10467 [Ilyonectria robusta]